MTKWPAGWASASLGELVEAVRGLTYKKEQAHSEAGKGLVPLLRATNVQDGCLLLEAHLYFIPETLVRHEQWLQPDDIVVASSSGSSSVVGKSAAILRPWRGTFGAFCTVLRPHAHVDPRFLAHFVASPSVRSRWSALAAGTNINNLKSAHVADTEVPLPPLNEQRRIVAAIEEQFSHLDAAEQSLRRALAQTRVLRPHIVDECSSAGASTTLADVLAEPLMNGRSVPTAEVGFPILRLSSLRNGSVDLREHKIGEWAESEAAPFQIRVDDFFIARGNGSLHLVGRGGLVEQEPTPMAYPDTLIRARVDTELIRPRYLRLAWHSTPVRRQIERQARTTAGIYKVNQQHLRAIEINVPSSAEQDRLILEAEQKLSLVDALQVATQSALLRGAALRRSILERAFRGELVPQNPSDEPASALIERIAAERAAAGVATGHRPRRRATMQGL